MIEVERDDFFVESIKNPIEYGTYYKINPKYGTGFQWTSEVHHDFIILGLVMYLLSILVAQEMNSIRIKIFLRIHCAAMNHLKSIKLFIILRFH